jgi:uncharacterized protein YjbJ (UPF0337 family)
MPGLSPRMVNAPGSSRYQLCQTDLGGTQASADAFADRGGHGPRPNLQHQEEHAMNWDRIEGNWKQLTGKVKEKWGKLTDDDITQINGNREQLEGKIQARYGFAKDQVRKDVDDWMGRM